MYFSDDVLSNRTLVKQRAVFLHYVILPLETKERKNMGLDHYRKHIKKDYGQKVLRQFDKEMKGKDESKAIAVRGSRFRFE